MYECICISQYQNNEISIFCQGGKIKKFGRKAVKGFVEVAIDLLEASNIEVIGEDRSPVDDVSPCGQSLNLTHQNFSLDSVADVVGLGLSFFHWGFHLGNHFVLASCSKEVKTSHKLSVLLYFSILGEKPLNIGAIQESCTCESQKSVIRRKVTPNLHTCAAEEQKEREPVSRFPLKKCLFIRLSISRSSASAGPRKPCRGGPRREPSHARCRGWRPGCAAWPA